MKTFDNDKELKKLIGELKLESPGKDFTMNVMNRVFEEKVALEEVKSDPVLGRGFWIIVSLFVSLFVITLIFSNSGAEQVSMFSKLVEGLNGNSVLNGYQSFFIKIGSLPLSIGGILLASTLLVFIDKFSSNITAVFHLKKA
jgi:hypothetical protein